MLLKQPTSRISAASPAQRPHCTPRFRPLPRQVATRSSLCPYRTLGVTETADEQEIKKAYRKLALKYHPDIAKTEDAERKFISIQEAYYILTGKARGKEATTSSSSSGQWDFHDWFWQFRMNRTWDRQQAGGPAAAGGAASTFQPEQAKENIRTQLAGLRHRAAIRRVKKMNETMDSMDEESDSESDPTPAAAPEPQPDVGFTEAADVSDGANYTSAPAPDAEQQQRPKPKFHMGEERRMHVSGQLAGLKRKGALKKQYST